jgi:DNA-binding response OmpR family regulator
MENIETKPTVKKKVCIVDDESSIREIYQIALEQAGYNVVTAVDGEDGLIVIEKEKPDIVLVDVMMPKINGLELIKTLRSSTTLPQKPIIVMTNVDNQEVMQEAGKLDTQFYLVKALFEPKKVVSIVDEVLHKS